MSEATCGDSISPDIGAYAPRPGYSPNACARRMQPDKSNRPNTTR